jgi:diguanylate cyclase (GGDEF)-like protein
MHPARWSDFGRYALYIALTIVPVVSLGVLLARTVESEARSTALDSALQRATTIAAAVESTLTDADLQAGPQGEERTELNRTMRDRLADGMLLRFRIRDLNGTVLYDASRPSAGTGKPQVDDEVLEVVEDARRDLDGDAGVLAHFTTVGADSVDVGEARAEHDGEPALEVYVALRFTNDGRDDIAGPDGSVLRSGDTVVVGVAEMYLPYSIVEQRTDSSVRRLVLLIAGGLTVLWLVLGGIVASVATREKRHRALAEQRALHDRLTGLPGRTIYADRLHAALAAGGRTGTDVALVVVDLDRFKEVNDTLGHRNGDELLCIVADRLTTALRPGDTVARLDGDEFGIVLPGARAETVELILRRLQDALVREAELGGVAVSVEASIGYAIWPIDADNAETLQQRADLALHTAKSARAAIVRYDEGIDEFDPQRLGLLAELRRAITNDELVLHYQPKVDATTHRVVAFEALVRWQHPTRGLLTPDEFIPIAESTGLIGPLTHWVVDRALGQLSQWSVTHPTLSMAVNISARNLRGDLPGWVLQRLAAHGIAPSRLTLEVTETSFASDPARATVLLEELAAACVRVSLDDFGQGYTSLGSLGHLPVSELKIDRGFVLAMSTSAEDRAIVSSVIDLGHRLGLDVVAEGVETEAVAEDLRQLGCDTMQGFLFSRAVPAAQVLALFDRLPSRT